MSEAVTEPPAAEVPWDLYDEAHDRLRAQVRAWVGEHVAPHVDAWERDGDLPRELFAAAGAAGLFGHKVDAAHGGCGIDFVADLVVTEELAGCWSGGVAAALGAHKDLGSYYIWRFGTPGQRRRWLPAAMRGEAITALAVTEPGAGSDVAGLAARAEVIDGGYLLNGTKTFITNGTWADVVVVAALTDPEPGGVGGRPPPPGGGGGGGPPPPHTRRRGHHGLSLLLVEADDPGFTRRRIPTLGWRTSRTGELSFADVELPADRLLGGPDQAGQGFVCIMRNFLWERIVMAAGAVRAADDVLSVAWAHAGAAHRRRLVDLAAEVEAARSLVRHAVRAYLAPAPDASAARPQPVTEVAMAKLLACDLAVEVCEAAIDARGREGALARTRLERALRDARLGPIGGGTREIMRELVGRAVVAEGAPGARR